MKKEKVSERRRKKKRRWMDQKELNKEDKGELWKCKEKEMSLFSLELSVKVQEFCSLASPQDQVIIVKCLSLS